MNIWLVQDFLQELGSIRRVIVDVKRKSTAKE